MTSNSNVVRESEPNWRFVIQSRVYGGAHINAEAAALRRVARLPCSAADFFFENDNDEHWGWGPTLKAILEGTRDPDSPLYALRGMESNLIQHVYNHVKSKWASHVRLTIPASCVGYFDTHEGIARFNEGNGRHCHSGEVVESLPRTSRHRPQNQEQGYVAFSSCGTVEFPEPTGRNVNMMPFIFGDRSSLPAELRCYHELIEACPYMGEEVGRVGYLTVHEGFVQAGRTQRREGLHVETHGLNDGSASFSPGDEHSWGCGYFWARDNYEGGIYLASNMADTSAVYDALVDKNVKGIIDKHGGCEHLRRLLGPATMLKANQLIWMTDCTPHEALEQEADGYRQFFRVVTSQISHWYAQHSTPNPLVAVPDNVAIVNDSKFDGEA